MQITIKRKQPRKYTCVLQQFHNNEHDPQGRNHCKSNGQHPYRIEHMNGKHKISARVAIGHGRCNKPQMFRFTKRLGNGFDMASGVKVSHHRGRFLARDGKTKSFRRRRAA